MPSTVLVIGRQGQVAHALQSQATAQMPQRSLLALGRPDLDLAQPDVADQVQRALDQHQPALVINAAAYTAVDRAEAEPHQALAINATAVGAIGQGCAERGIPLLHLSTDYVFDGSGTAPWAPDAPTQPLGVYGASKLRGEQLLQEVCAQHLILRVSWVFGQQGANFVRTMLRLAAERDELRVVDDQVGGPTSAEAIAVALLQLVEPCIANRSPLTPHAAPFPWGLHHLQGQPLVSWHGFAQEIVSRAVAHGVLERAPAVVPITTDAFPTPARRPTNSRLDCRSSIEQLGLTLPSWREDLDQWLQQLAR